MSGTAIAQAIPIIISPILTRIYLPENFGIFATYLAIASILSVISTGRYELAIMLPKKNSDAANILALTILVLSGTTLLLFALTTTFGNYLVITLLKRPEITPWIYFIPITVFISGITTSLGFWFNRENKYKRLSFFRITQNATTSATNLTMGFLNFEVGGLIGGSILGPGLASTIYAKKIWNDYPAFHKLIFKLKIMALAKRYIRFPKYDIPSTLINISSNQLPFILFNSYFGAHFAGLYYLTQRVLQTPISFVSASILDVFKNEAAKNFKEHGNAKAIYISTFKRLVFLSVAPSILLYFIIIPLFVIFFGEQWRTAGEAAQILVPMLFMRFVSSPLSFMFYIGEKQKQNLMIQSLFLISVLASFYFNDNFLQVIKLISYSFSVIYLIQTISSAKIAKIF